jgi:hypothetical protein
VLTPELFQPDSHSDQLISESAESLADDLPVGSHRRQHAYYDRIFMYVHAAAAAIAFVHGSDLPASAARRRTLKKKSVFP